jgi:hypothetical protein
LVPAKKPEAAPEPEEEDAAVVAAATSVDEVDAGGVNVDVGGVNVDEGASIVLELVMLAGSEPTFTGTAEDETASEEDEDEEKVELAEGAARVLQRFVKERPRRSRFFGWMREGRSNSEVGATAR